MKINYPEKLFFLKEYCTKNVDFLVKIGGYKDGGYAVDYRSILQSKILISGGVGSNVRFESDFYDINQNCGIILIDPTTSLLRMLIRGVYHFFKKNQSGYRSLSDVLNYLFLKKKSLLIKKYLGNKFNLNDIKKDYINLKYKNNIFLKLDIEGSEYELLPSIIENKSMFSSICIEFHGLDIESNVNELILFIEKLNFDIIHISINELSLNQTNVPSILEISFAPKNCFNTFDFSEFLQNSNTFNNEPYFFDNEK